MSQIETAKELHNQGQYEAAVEAYKTSLAQEPNNDEAHHGLSDAYSRINKLDLALEHAKHAVNLVPNSDRYLQNKGQMLFASGLIEDALKTFKRSIKENPNLFYSYLAIGDIYTVKKDVQKAKEHYKLAMKVHEHGVPAVVRLSRLMMLEGDFENAENLLLETELKFPNETSLKLQIGVLRLELEEYGFAELYFKKILENEPSNRVAKACLALSLLQSQPEQAKQILSELLAKYTQIPEVKAAVGILYYHNGLFNESIKVLLPLCQSGLAYASWFMVLAKAYARNGQPQHQISVLEALLGRGNNSKALMMLGKVHQDKGDYLSAIKTLSQINQGDPQYLSSLVAQAACHYANSEYPQTIKKLDVVLNTKPDHNAALKLKLNALSQMEQYDEALEIIAAIDSENQIKSFNQLLHFYAGLLLDKKQRYEQAWTHFKAIEVKQPEDIEILNKSDEKTVQKFSSEEIDPSIKFVFADPATGQQDFVHWLAENNIAAIDNRNSGRVRDDVFTKDWTVRLLGDLNEAQIHFLRKKYIKKLRTAVDTVPESMVDFLPFSPINAAIIKRVFPQSQVLILSRNFADLRLNNRVFGTHRAHYLEFSKIANQMIAMNPNVSLVDIDAWQNQDEAALTNIQKMFGKDVVPFSLTETQPLNRVIFPFMHWKNYQKFLNTEQKSS